MLAVIALTVKMLVPDGYMPGTSLARPVVLCPGQGPMPMMAMDQHDHRVPAKTPRDKADHRCAFAGTSAAALAPAVDGAPAAIPSRRPVTGRSRGDPVPGRGDGL